MSQWFDQSANANKLRQSYLKGFLDISGGGVLIRSDNSLNFYTTADGVNSKFAMDATNFKVINPANASTKNSTVGSAGAAVNVATQKLAYIADLSENVQSALNYFYTFASNTTTGLASSSANIAGSATIGGKLYVMGDSFFNSNVDVNGNLKVGGDAIIDAQLYVKGDSYLQGRLFVTEDASFHSNVYVEGLVIAQNALVALTDASLNNRLYVAKDASLNSKLWVNQATTLNDTLYVKEAATFNNKISVVSDSSFTNSVTIGETLYVKKLVIGESGATDAGSFSVDQLISAKGGIDVSNGLRATGDSLFHNKLHIIGDVSMDAALHIGGASTMDSSLYVTGATTLKSSLTATDGAITLGKAATATALHGIVAIAQDATDTLALGYTGKLATFSGAVGIAQDASMEGKLFVSADASMNSKLSVQGDVSLNSKLGVMGNAKIDGKITTGSIVINDSAYSSPNSIRTTAGNLVLASAGEEVLIPQNLKISGNLIVDGTTTTLNTIVNVTEAFDVSNNGSRTALNVEQYNSSFTIAEFGYGGAATNVFTVGANNSVGINKLTTESSQGRGFDYALDVSGSVGISDTLKVSKDVEFVQALKVDGNYSSAVGNMTLTAGKMTSSTILATGDASFNTDVSIGGRLYLPSLVFGSGFLDQSIHW
jgi:UDP-3-O-[3-hydroxymyristoyl] glucosamine N-acyltransferase